MSIAEQLKQIMENANKQAAPEEVIPDEVVTEETNPKSKSKKYEGEGEDDGDERDEDKKEKVQESKEKDPNKKGKPEEVTKGKDDGQNKQKKPAISFEMKESLDNFRKLAEEAELPSDTVDKMLSIFEAAVIKNVQEHVAVLEEQQEARINELSEQYEEYQKEQYDGLVENMDGYLSYVAEEWMNDNEVALEKGVKSEISESLLKGLKGLLTEHNIDVPEDKVDVVEKLQADNARLVEMNEKLLQKGKQLTETVESIQRGKLIESVCEGLTESQAEKFRDLAESLDYKDEESFSNKLHQIRESFFSKKESQQNGNSVITDNPVELTEETNNTSIHPDVNDLLTFFNNQK